jgi:dATP pyrophosphohydrolase
MPQVLSDIVDVYVFRRLNARVQFLLLQRRSDVALPHTWQAFHSQVRVGDTSLQTITETVKSLAGLNISAVYSADYINQFYDEGRDAIVLAPVFAVNVSPQSPIDLGDDYRDAAWFGRDEATARLPFSGQRWAVRHIDEIMSLGEAESGIYQIDMATIQPHQQLAGSVDDLDDDDQVSEQYDETLLATAAQTPDAGHRADDGRLNNPAPGEEESS